MYGVCKYEYFEWIALGQNVIVDGDAMLNNPLYTDEMQCYAYVCLFSSVKYGANML